jgi:ribonuclease D
MPFMSRNPAAALPHQSAQRISREEMNDLLIGRYEGSVHLVAAPADVQRAMGAICNESVIGFDVKTRPAFRTVESYLPSLVEFATAGAMYLMPVESERIWL